MILVVDDDHSIVQLARSILEKAGYEVSTAHNGEQAYAHVKDSNCQGMLLDMMMPGINGPGLLMLMAADKIELPVIIMAGSPDFDEQELKEFTNVKKLLHKPFYAEDLLSSVREHFGS